MNDIFVGKPLVSVDTKANYCPYLVLVLYALLSYVLKLVNHNALYVVCPTFTRLTGTLLARSSQYS